MIHIKNQSFNYHIFNLVQYIYIHIGNSKQAAKTEAAKEGVKTLLSKESYIPERAAIVLSVQKSKKHIHTISLQSIEVCFIIVWENFLYIILVLTLLFFLGIYSKRYIIQIFEF